MTTLKATVGLRGSSTRRYRVIRVRSPQALHVRQPWWLSAWQRLCTTFYHPVDAEKLAARQGRLHTFQQDLLRHTTPSTLNPVGFQGAGTLHHFIDLP